MNFTIRQASIDDLEIVINLWKKLSVNQLSRDEYYNGNLDLEGGYEQFSHSLTSKNCCILLACNNTSIIGFIEVWLNKKDFYFFEDDYAYILHMYVEPDYKNYQLSTTLFKKAEDWAISKGSKYIEADVFEFNSDCLKILEVLGLKPYRTRSVKRI